MQNVKPFPDYKQQRYSVQLCWLISKNLINSLDVMSYADNAGKEGPLRQLTLARIEDLYNKRGGPQLPDTCKNPADVFEEHAAEFENIFKIELSTFLSERLLSVKLKNFDIVAFDKWLQVPDGTSTKDFITEKYGNRAAALVKSLL